MESFAKSCQMEKCVKRATLKEKLLLKKEKSVEMQKAELLVMVLLALKKLTVKEKLVEMQRQCFW